MRDQFTPLFLERFWTHVEKTDTCWNWIGAHSGFGYGQMSFHGRKFSAHRASWEIHYGPIPAGMHVCHHCDNPQCCHPAHLFLGTQADNVADMLRKGRQNVAGRTAHLPRGETHHRAKLTNELVREIRTRAADGETYAGLARSYGLDPSTIRCVANGTSWRHLPDATPVDRTPHRQDREMTYKGETRTILEWANDIGLAVRILRQRLNRGWTVEDALTTPPRPHRRKL